ncbi:unnamed protein product [Dibothriocephalus latus]|uniref:C2H2-type domain-containing protein n=1 Tax=Dibothriocephalus latus TaxID=60516 RepID=A0A3P7LWV9_DIBLA|nr:unnamed protein product [Dibothriocephalus latus]
MIDQNFLDVTSATPPLPPNHVDTTAKFRNNLTLQTDHGMPLSLMSYNREDTPKTPLDSSLLLGSTKTQNNVDSLFAPSPSNHDFLDIELPVDPSTVQEIKDLRFNEPRCDTTIRPSSGLVTPPDTRVVCSSNGSNLGGHDPLARQGLPDNAPDIIASRLRASHSLQDDVDGIAADHLKVIKDGSESSPPAPPVLPSKPTAESNANQGEIYDDAEYAAAAVAAVDSVVSALAGNKTPRASGALDPALTGTGTDRLYSLSLAPGPSLVNCNSRVCRNFGDAADPCCSEYITCPNCRKAVLVKMLLKQRMIPEEAKHVCDNCKRSFVREDKLKRHIMSIHTMEKPHICHICTKAFSRK